MEYINLSFLKSKFQKTDFNIKNLRSTLINLPNLVYQGFQNLKKKSKPKEFDPYSYEFVEPESNYQLPDYSQGYYTVFKDFDNQAKKDEVAIKVQKNEYPPKISNKQKDKIEAYPADNEPKIERILNIPEFQPNKSILSPLSRCCICKQFTASIGFLCNHNYCENCLADICCNQIVKFTKKINNGAAENKRKFSYRCFADKCRKDISVPTKKVVKFWLENKLKYDTQGYREFFQEILQNHIPLFDGVSF